MTKVVMKPGKFYVVDVFSGPIAGPFNTSSEAERERVQFNTADDCEVAECYVTDPVSKRCKLRPVVAPN